MAKLASGDIKIAFRPARMLSGTQNSAQAMQNGAPASARWAYMLAKLASEADKIASRPTRMVSGRQNSAQGMQNDDPAGQNGALASQNSVPDT